MTRGPYDLFLSHNRRQKPWVRRLVVFLRALKLHVFFDEDDILPGEDIIAAIEEAVEASKILVLVLSRSSVTSKWVSFETAISIISDPSGSDKRLIPLLVEPLDPLSIRLAIRRLDLVDLTDPTTREREFLGFLKCLGIRSARARQFSDWPDFLPKERLRVVDAHDIIARNWSGKRLLHELIRFDYQVIEGLQQSHEGDEDQWAPVFMDHPDTWKLLEDGNGKLVGYWHFVPLFADAYSRAKRGDLLDSEITADQVRVFELPGEYDIYFVVFSLLTEFRHTKAMILLVDSILDNLERLSSDGVFIRDIVANAYTKSGESLCKSLGLGMVTNHRERGVVYYANIMEILAAINRPRAEDLLKIYRRTIGC
jgi:TIR domain